MKKIILPLIIGIVISSSCKKSNDANQAGNSTQKGYKIEIVKGNNQTDTLGNLLKDSVIVRVTKDGALLKNAYVRFETSGCDDNNNFSTDVPTYHGGVAGYRWRLNGNLGNQSLKITLLDSLRTKKDSTVAAATGIMPTKGWFRSSCTPNTNPIINSFCKLSSGRLIAAFNSIDYPYYSDDNAITWHQLKTFPLTSGLYIVKLIATTTDEIFASTQNNGLYYSKNGGQTWEIRNTGITDLRYFVDMNFTNSGKLIYTTYFGGVFISADKGQSWRSAMTGLSFGDRFHNPSEQINGDLYLVSDVGALYKSTDIGLHWNAVSLNFTYDVQSVFINDAGDIFIGASNATAELYRLTNGGSAWLKVYTAAPLPGVYREIQKMSKQSNGSYYFYTYGNGLVSTTDFINYSNITPFYTEQSRVYITAKNGELVIGTQFNGIYYNLQ